MSEELQCLRVIAAWCRHDLDSRYREYLNLVRFSSNSDSHDSVRILRAEYDRAVAKKHITQDDLGDFKLTEEGWKFLFGDMDAVELMEDSLAG